MARVSVVKKIVGFEFFGRWNSLICEGNRRLNILGKHDYYLRQGGYVFAGFCLFVCLSVSKITQKVMDESF